MPQIQKKGEDVPEAQSQLGFNGSSPAVTE